jgi:hypothetical protein
MQKIPRISFLLIAGFIAVIAISSCKRHDGKYNPFLHAKTKPSEQLQKDNNKTVKKMNRAYKKQMKKNHKAVGY